MREKLARLLAFGTGLVIVLFSVLFAFIQNPINTHLPPGTRSLPSTSTTPVITYLDPESIKAGHMVYREHTCARCHSIAGKGNPRNPLDNVGLKLASTTMRGWITGEDSLQGLLPERAFKQKQPYKDLSEDELTALVIYMQSLRPEHMQTTPTEPVAEPDSALSGENGSCLSCHSNAGHLMQVVIPPATPPEDGCATAPSRPAFLNAFVNPQFIETVHGEIGCTGCHGGDASMEEKEGAHKGMKAAETSCVSCHEQISELHATSLHGSLNGMVHALKMRSGEDNFHKLNIPWEKDCASCHGGCSACHVTLPKAVGGGLIKGHEFFKRPPMKDSCAVCHGSRAGGEYLGQWDGYKPDVHYDAGMHCLDCHTNDLHGDGKTYTNRWEVAGRPQCTDCHDALPNDNAKAHDSKHKNISC